MVVLLLLLFFFVGGNVIFVDQSATCGTACKGTYSSPYSSLLPALSQTLQHNQYLLRVFLLSDLTITDASLADSLFPTDRFLRTHLLDGPSAANVSLELKDFHCSYETTRSKCHLKKKVRLLTNRLVFDVFHSLYIENVHFQGAVMSPSVPRSNFELQGLFNLRSSASNLTLVSTLFSQLALTDPTLFYSALIVNLESRASSDKSPSIKLIDCDFSENYFPLGLVQSNQSETRLEIRSSTLQNYNPLELSESRVWWPGSLDNSSLFVLYHPHRVTIHSLSLLHVYLPLPLLKVHSHSWIDIHALSVVNTTLPPPLPLFHLLHDNTLRVSHSNAVDSPLTLFHLGLKNHAHFLRFHVISHSSHPAVPTLQAELSNSLSFTACHFRQQSLFFRNSNNIFVDSSLFLQDTVQVLEANNTYLASSSNFQDNRFSSLRLSRHNEVLIQHSNFTGGNSTLLLLQHNRLSLDNCSFSSSPDRVIFAESDKSLTVSRCAFTRLSGTPIRILKHNTLQMANSSVCNNSLSQHFILAHSQNRIALSHMLFKSSSSAELLVLETSNSLSCHHCLFARLTTSSLLYYQWNNTITLSASRFSNISSELALFQGLYNNSLALTDCRISNVSQAEALGALVILGTKNNVTLTRTQMSNNSVQYVQAFQQNRVEILDSEIRELHTLRQVIWLEEANHLVIKGSTVVKTGKQGLISMRLDNHLSILETDLQVTGSIQTIAQAKGGEIRLIDSKISSTNVGSLIVSTSGSLLISGTIVVTNNTEQVDSLLMLANSNITVSDTLFASLQTPQMLGSVSRSIVSIVKSVVQGMKSLRVHKSLMTIQTSRMTNMPEAALKVEEGETRITNSTFRKNRGKEYGSISIINPVRLVLQQNLIQKCSAQQGSGVYVLNGGEVVIESNTLVNNTGAISRSGVIHLGSSEPRGGNLRVSKNSIVSSSWHIFCSDPECNLTASRHVYTNTLHSARVVNTSGCLASVRLLNPDEQSIYLPDPSIHYSLVSSGGDYPSHSISDNTICINHSSSAPDRLFLSLSQTPHTRLPLLPVTLRLKRCSSGHFLSASGMQCLPCPPSSYSFLPSSGHCTQCPVSSAFSCQGGPSLVTHPDFYRQSPQSDHFVKCHVSSVCSGGTVSKQCARGYQGSLCKECQSGYSHITTNICWECSLWYNSLKSTLHLLWLLLVLLKMSQWGLKVQEVRSRYLSAYWQLETLKQETLLQAIVHSQFLLLATRLFQFKTHSAFQEYLLEPFFLLLPFPSRLANPLGCLFSLSLHSQLLLSSLFPFGATLFLFGLLKVYQHLAALLSGLRDSPDPEPIYLQHRTSSRLSFNPAASILPSNLPPLRPSHGQHLLLSPTSTQSPPSLESQLSCVFSTVLTLCSLDILCSHGLALQSTDLGSSASPGLFTIADYATPFDDSHDYWCYALCVPTLLLLSLLLSLKHSLSTLLSRFRWQHVLPQLRRLLYLLILVSLYSSLDSAPQLPLLLCLLLTLLSLYFLILWPPFLTADLLHLHRFLILSELLFLLALLFYPSTSAPWIALLSLALFLQHPLRLICATNSQLRLLLQPPPASVTTEHIRQSQHSLAELFTPSMYLQSLEASGSSCPPSPSSLASLSYQLFKQNVFLKVSIALEEQQIESLENQETRKAEREEEQYQKRREDNEGTLEDLDIPGESGLMSMNQLFQSRAIVEHHPLHFAPDSEHSYSLLPLPQALLHLTQRNRLNTPGLTTLTISASLSQSRVRGSDYYLCIHLHLQGTRDPLSYLQVSVEDCPDDLVLSHSRTHHSKASIVHQILARKYSLAPTPKVPVTLSIGQESSEHRVSLDLPVNLTQFMLCYRMSDYPAFLEQYNKTYVVSKLFPYSETLVKHPKELAIFFPRWEYISEKLAEEEKNDLKTRLYGVFELVVLKTCLVFCKVKVSRKKSMLLIKMGFMQDGTQEDQLKQDVLEALIQEYQRAFNL